MADSKLKLGSVELRSRLILGTGKYSNFEIMQKCHDRSGTEMVTVALRRVNLAPGLVGKTRNIIDFIDTDKITLLPNTAGAQTATESLRIARLAANLQMTHLKIEVIAETNFNYWLHIHYNLSIISD